MWVAKPYAIQQGKNKDEQNEEIRANGNKGEEK